MSSAAERYTFPNAAQFDSLLNDEPSRADIEAQDKAFQEAMRQGYTEGFEAGRAAAEVAAKVVLQDGHRQGFAAGRDEGLIQAEEAAAALTQAFEQFCEWRAELLDEAETFCVEVALAVVARLLELNEHSAEFVTRTVQAAIRAVLPELPQAISVNPGISTLVASAFPQLEVRAENAIPPGGVRIEAGRLLVETNVQLAFEKIKASLLETRGRRKGLNGINKKRSLIRNGQDKTPIAEGAN